LYISQKKESAYIFAPVSLQIFYDFFCSLFIHLFMFQCPHEAACPRLQSQDGTPCNFEVRYPPFLTKSNHYFKERFCYVIIGKGIRPDTIPAWPRIVRPTLVRRKHTICRLCTPAGKLQEIIFTPAKSGKLVLYRYCAMKSGQVKIFSFTTLAK
jgi:ribosomal protein RSM22 (predicted rRNA methylase)